MPEGLASLVERLVHKSLIPLLDQREIKHGLDPQLVSRAVAPQVARDRFTETLAPMLMAGMGEVLAASVRFSFDKQGIGWILPEEVASDPVPWVRSAIEVWREADSRTFPRDHVWKSNRRWQTASDAAAAEALSTHQSVTRRMVEERAQEEGELQQSFDLARAEAEGGERRLLTEDGDELKVAVIAALRVFEFDVEDMDAGLEDGQERFEDLHVRDDDWIGLTEVRGYTRGAKANDLALFGAKFLPHYLRQSGGQMPCGHWYIVNDFRNEPPHIREPIFKGAKRSVTIFADAGVPGHVIRTTDLFQLVMAVREGRLTKKAARKMLTTATGIFGCSTGSQTSMRAPVVSTESCSHGCPMVVGCGTLDKKRWCRPPSDDDRKDSH